MCRYLQEKVLVYKRQRQNKLQQKRQLKEVEHVKESDKRNYKQIKKNSVIYITAAHIVVPLPRNEPKLTHWPQVGIEPPPCPFQLLANPQTFLNPASSRLSR